jgi:hypothetical protein
VAKFSALRLGLTVGCAVAHTYFTLRLRGYLRCFGIFSFAVRILHNVAVQPVASVLALIAKASPGADAQPGITADNKAPDAAASCASSSVRPAGITLSDEEERFFDVCDLLIASERDATAAAAAAPGAVACARAPHVCCWRTSPPPAASAEPAAVARGELGGLLQECPTWVAAHCRAGTSDAACAGLDVVTKALDASYVPPSIPDAAKIDRCCRALRALMDGTTPQLLAATGGVGDAAASLRAGSVWRRPFSCARLPCTADGGAASNVDISVTHAPAAAAYDEEQTAVVPLYAISFLAAADASVWGAGCDAKRSFALAKPVTSVDFFLSHTWGDDAASKTAVLRTFLFMQSYVAVTIIATVMFALTFVPAGCIVAELDTRIPWWALSVAAAGLGLLALLWGIACHAAGARTLVPWRWSALTLWLDKCCIDQNSDASKQAGIAHLGDSLERSQRMLVIFSASYLERLWCTYELAKFCMLIKQQRARAEAQQQKGDADAAVATAAEAEPQKSLLFLSLSWSAWWNPVNVMRTVVLSTGEDELLSNYCCRKAKFWKRGDQETVLKMIREEWDGGEDAFNAFVRTELREVLLAGKREYYQQAWRAMWESLILLFN